MSDSSPVTELHLKDAVHVDAHITPAQERSLLTILSGQSQRWHMHPFMPPQNFADRAWHVAAILSLIDPNCTVEELKTALFHDVAKLSHGDISAFLKRANADLAQSHEAQEIETIARWTGLAYKPSPAMKIADELADLWLLAIHSRLGNQEATAGYRKHRRSLEAMDLEKFPTAIEIRDAIEEWCLYGSTILREEIS